VISSLGIDIVEIDRFRQAAERRPRMLARLFTEGERAYCAARADPFPHYAARFAAKEAAAKAFARWLRWQEVEVVNDAGGRPSISLSGEAAQLGRVSEGGHLLVSLSHSRDYAVAAVVLVLPQEIP
jgi:holo-[acyl-carrier protein] synthase